LHLIVATSSPNAFAAKLLSSVVTLLFLIVFIQIIAYRSSIDGVLSACYNDLAFLALSCCGGVKNPNFLQLFWRIEIFLLLCSCHC